MRDHHHAIAFRQGGGDHLKHSVGETMIDWSDGYHTEALYTYGYYKELSPSLQRLAVLLAGYEPLPVTDDDVHMELGFGQGISINIHAASQAGRYIGNDFNPSHVAHAQYLAHAAHTHIELSDDSFAQMDARTDLPMCNSISLHGIWSWINDENRQHIINIIQKHLKPGGIVYNSYNSISGHAGFLPWRHMMWQHFQQQTGTALERIGHTIAHFAAMFEKNPTLLDNNPVLKSTWERIQSADRHYLLHEYFNANWDCFSLSQVNEQMQGAKLQFVGTTASNAYINHLAMDENRLAQVQAQPNVLAAESWRDVLLGNTFRQDLYIKGGEALSQPGILRRLQQMQFVCTVEASQFGNFLFSTQDSRRFNDDLFEPVKALLVADNYAPKSFAQIQAAVDSKYSWQHILQLLLLKIHVSQLQPCVTTVSEQTRQQCHDLNLALLGKMDDKVSGVYVASPVTGMGLTLEFIYAWALRTWLLKPTASLDDISENIWQGLQTHNQVLIDESGKKLASREEHVQLIHSKLAQAQSLRTLWQALGLLP